MCAIKFILVIVVFASIRAEELPNGFNTCSRSDPKFNECLTKTVTEALMLLKNGNKSLT